VFTCIWWRPRRAKIHPEHSQITGGQKTNS